MELTKEKLAKMIDHTNLKPFDVKKKIEKLCTEAKIYNFYSVCVNPIHTKFVKKQLEGSDVKVAVVVGFPLGSNLTETKVFETKKAIDDGADEIDMVMHVWALRSKEYNLVHDDIAAVVEAANGAIVKVILETCYLTDEEITKACNISLEAGAHFVKTSTGFGAFGAFPHHVEVMRKAVGGKMGIKASGGIKNFKDAYRLIKAGATRLGTSASVSIVEGFNLYKFSPSLLEEEEIPCHFCPSRHAKLDKMPKALYRYYIDKCKTCEYKEYNIFYD